MRIGLAWIGIPYQRCYIHSCCK